MHHRVGSGLCSFPYWFESSLKISIKEYLEQER